ncbi:hypothetical protein E2562_000125 [Oryza meyeriana var. granulata]|uniref:SKP1-like protein n=1 Tax=Oryza meyeriana var. granulata TaxID=110450 RepID=A0A6G1DAL5_9ORYZ|nr:hypothetical protein E2562_000125 [Oryza meyeriana var. granulata]
MAVATTERTSSGDTEPAKKTVDLVSNEGERKVPLPNINSAILTRVIDYCVRHAAVAASMDDDGLERFDDDFLSGVDQDTPFDLLLAANYLQVNGLLDLTCMKVAGMMKGKTPEQIWETFHIVNDLTPEEENEIRREISWAFD